MEKLTPSQRRALESIKANGSPYDRRATRQNGKVNQMMDVLMERGLVEYASHGWKLTPTGEAAIREEGAAS